MKTTLLLTTLLFTLTGCATIDLLPGAENVVFTQNPKDIMGCKVIGQDIIINFKSSAGAHDGRNRFFIKGGDTFLVTGKWGLKGRAGVIYNCSGIDARQPVPVQVKEVK